MTTLEFQIGSATVRVGPPEYCPDCLSLNVRDGVCVDCEDAPELQRGDVSDRPLDDMDGNEQYFASREFGFDLVHAHQKVCRRGDLLRSNVTQPYRLYEYHPDGSVSGIYEQEHPNRISARSAMPVWTKGCYQIFEGGVAITARLKPSK